MIPLTTKQRYDVTVEVWWQRSLLLSSLDALFEEQNCSRSAGTHFHFNSRVVIRTKFPFGAADTKLE
eukprot:scaffold2817_cov76-Skeletonema_marinoi.AAC.2